MRNGWTATAGEDFIAIASNQSVIDLLSKDETVPSVIARLSGRFVCSLRSQSISIARSGLIIAYKNTEAHPDPACQQLCDSGRKTCAALALCFARLRAIAILVTGGEDARQIAIGAKKDRRSFGPKCVQSNRYWLASGDLRVRAVTVKSVNFGQDCIRPQAESSTSFQMRRLTTALS